MRTHRWEKGDYPRMLMGAPDRLLPTRKLIICGISQSSQGAERNKGLQDFTASTCLMARGNKGIPLGNRNRASQERNYNEARRCRGRCR